MEIGIDIVEINEIRKRLNGGGDSFRNRTFSKREIRECESNPDVTDFNYACKFAVKEAFMKAIGIGWLAGLQWKYIESLNGVDGTCNINLAEEAIVFMQLKSLSSIAVSVSHTNEIAIAIVILDT